MFIDINICFHYDFCEIHDNIESEVYNSYKLFSVVIIVRRNVTEGFPLINITLILIILPNGLINNQALPLAKYLTNKNNYNVFTGDRKI